jgi:phage terminase small subunit
MGHKNKLFPFSLKAPKPENKPKSPMPAKDLSDKQKKFCQEYLIDFNATQAYLRAGYATTPKSANASGPQLLVNPSIQAYLARLRTEIGNDTKVTLERTLEEIAHVAFSRISHAQSFSSDGVTLKDSESLDDSVLAAIQSVSVTESFSEKGSTISHSLKLHNKMAALALLAKFYGIDSDFNQARATLRKYGLALLEDSERASGWRVELVS